MSVTNNLVAGRTQSFTYDELLRLLTAQRGPDTNIQTQYTMDYDRYGNRWIQDLVAGTGYETSHSFNAANNRVTTSGFTYDNSGNITDTGPSPALTYNLESFMTAAGTSTYVYDAEGRRVKKTVSGTTTDYFYLGSVVVSEKQGSNWTDYVFFGGQRIAKQTGATASTATYWHTDHLGSTRVCTDSSGDSTGNCYYEPFGELQPGTACPATVTYRYAGMEFDSETGFYHTWFRPYDPSQGRWLSVDPLAGSADTPQSLDRYVYVLNDPANLVDPLGLTHAGLNCWEREVEGGPPITICEYYWYMPGRCHDFYIDGGYAGTTCEVYGNETDWIEQRLQRRCNENPEAPGCGLTNELEKALSKPKCAVLLGAAGNVSKLFGKFNLQDVTSPGFDPTAFRGFDRHIRRVRTNRDIANTSDWVGAPIFVGELFNNTSVSGQASIIVHEFRHQAGRAEHGGSMGFLIKEFTLIRQACGTDFPSALLAFPQPRR